VTPGIARALTASSPDVVVVSGWSTFAAQAAIAWCRANRRPGVLVVESPDEGPRPGWRRAVKQAVVPSIVANAAAVLVTGSLARRSMLSRGAEPDRIHVFANTIDVDAFAQQADRLRVRRFELREALLGATDDDVVVLYVGRLAPEKRLDVLVRACVADERILLVLTGGGPARPGLEQLAADQGVRLRLQGDLPWHEVLESYVAADVFALLSERETWGVVVNEAAAAGLPLVVSDRVGAAHDLVREGQNGFVVPAGDVPAAADAIRRLAEDPSLRSRFGERSREIARAWGYEPSVEGFLAAVRTAVARSQG
jgi:glycosyltransferase involved in cell wall biosynthesis